MTSEPLAPGGPGTHKRKSPPPVDDASTETKEDLVNACEICGEFTANFTNPKGQRTCSHCSRWDALKIHTQPDVYGPKDCLTHQWDRLLFNFMANYLHHDFDSSVTAQKPTLVAHRTAKAMLHFWENEEWEAMLPRLTKLIPRGLTHFLLGQGKEDRRLSLLTTSQVVRFFNHLGVKGDDDPRAQDYVHILGQFIMDPWQLEKLVPLPDDSPVPSTLVCYYGCELFSECPRRMADLLTIWKFRVDRFYKSFWSKLES